ncbi:MAG TPA: hypothetical protein VMM13_20770 [Euzebya sp.]|nr:hypothetical protein [Euzebya sp.]
MCPRSTLAVLLVLGLLASGCQALGIRQTVDESQARDLLTRAVGLAASGQLDHLCTLSPADASTCSDSLETTGNVVPGTGPQIVCIVAAPASGPLRGGQVLVVEGVDAVGDPYTTEFIVYDSGHGVGVLDAVFWSGLSVVSYAGDTVSWRFDSASQTCERGALPGSPDPPATVPHPSPGL